ncbi:tRNA G18 (ribose-2'-O)-methylase SpoU [Streptosporangium subroseum]|uniref:tRNA G18 (Ribose-2'-O)-methylase SpoU n=1 Tax=Streptosporangium subroseum TaxID=106412 RepID=A0A239BDK0_9ACTN|nr:RNA methyltransferase [Streptosporangium subroseum]SNS06010.1 tRNA G18 (ribose-2'-O)-methylase SpoU [Streptosporangium subroseum]
MPNLSDPRLADYANLRDVELRKSLEAEHGLFIAEGEKVIRRAVAAGYPVRSVLLAPRWTEPLADLLDELGDRVHVVDDAVVEDITGFPVHRGALAAMERLPLPTVEQVLTGHGALSRGIPALADPAGRVAPSQPIPAVKDLHDRRHDHDHDGAGDHDHGDSAGDHDRGDERGDVERVEPRFQPPRRVLILEDLVDHGNVGAIFRCAAALGVEAVILSPRCADPLYRRSVKVSMGAVFAIPYARMTNWHGGLAELRAAGFQTLALTPDQSVTPLDRVAMAERVALLLGSEGDGLSSRWLREADEAVCIPMSPAAMGFGVDSLNVVAAAAIACHGLMRTGSAGLPQRG